MLIWTILRLFALVVLGATSRTPQAPSELPLSTFLPKDEGELEDAKGYYKLLFPESNGKACSRKDFVFEKTLFAMLKTETSVSVCLAHHTATGKPVVIKRVHNTSLDSIRMEEIAFYMLDHPNILKGVGTFLENDPLAVNFAMEFTTENTLWKWIDTPKASDPEFLRSIARQLVDVLAYLHDKDIIHNDVRPPNILVSDDGIVKLIDYGISVFCDSDGTTIGIGTPGYNSPERLSGSYKNGADWFALAVTLVQFKIKMHPFGCHIIESKAKESVSRGLPKLEDPIFNDFVQKIGHVDPDVRWSHANGNMDDIRNHPFLKNSDDLTESKTPVDTVSELAVVKVISSAEGAVATLDDTQ
jgi:serine/threonine-protein kinase